MGFGLACAPVRCAHLSFWAHCHPKRGTARPPPAHRSFAASYSTPKIYKIYPTLAAHVKDFFLSTVPQRLWGPLPPVPPLPAIFWGQKYIPVRPYALIFSVFIFFSFWIFSFRYSLLFLLSFSISSYSSLLISFYSFRRAILRLLILLLLYFQLFVALHTCILIIYVHISVILRGF